MRFSERPLTLPHSILALDVGGGVVSVKSSSSSNSVLGAVGVFGAQVGVVDNLTLRAAPVAMTFAPEVQYTGAVVAGATFRFLRGLLDMGASLDLQYHAVDPSGASILFGLPMLFHLGQYARLDVAPQFASISRSVSTNGVALPISFTIQPADRFFFGGTGSVSTLAKTQRTRGSTTLSAGGYLGVTLGPADGPLVDLRPSVEWSSLRIDDSDTSLDVLAGGLDVIGHLAL